MDLVITYNKTYQDRYLEYRNVLSFQMASVSQIKKEWSLYMELTVDVNGWQALWKIPRLTCEKLQIAFPTVVLTYVKYVDYEAMEATVKVTAVQDDIHLPERHNVPLIQLWPTKEQDKTVVLDIQTTANAIDMLRFFYTNIFMPWDKDEEYTDNWLNKHLQSRLHLYYDLRNGTIPNATSEHIIALLSEARRLQARYDLVELEARKDADLINEKNETLENLVNIYLRIIQIRNEVEILENPVLRKAFLNSQQQQLQATATINERENWLVFPAGNSKEYVEFLNKVNSDVLDENVKFVSSLNLALESATSLDKIILNPSKHVLGSLIAPLQNFTLKGVYSRNETVVVSTDEDVMFNSTGDVLMENLSLDIQKAQYGIVVRSGTLTMKNCKITGSGNSTIARGIIVLAESKLELVDCEISGFYTAIFGNSFSKIVIKNSTIFEATIGLQMFENCSVVVEQSTFQNCKDYGVCFETNNSIDDKTKVGNFELLQVIPDVKTNDITGENNGKGDVIVKKKLKLEPIIDLFTTNNTVESDEEMALNSDDKGEQNSFSIEVQ